MTSHGDVEFLSWEQTQLCLGSKPRALAPLWAWALSFVVIAMLSSCVRHRHICWLLCHCWKPRKRKKLLSHGPVHETPVAAHPPAGTHSLPGRFFKLLVQVWRSGGVAHAGALCRGRLWTLQIPLQCRMRCAGCGPRVVVATGARGAPGKLRPPPFLWFMRGTYPMPSGHLLSREHKFTIQKTLLRNIFFPSILRKENATGKRFSRGNHMSVKRSH